MVEPFPTFESVRIRPSVDPKLDDVGFFAELRACERAVFVQGTTCVVTNVTVFPSNADGPWVWLESKGFPIEIVLFELGEVVVPMADLRCAHTPLSSDLGGILNTLPNVVSY